jgi:hypothetical protein
MAERRGPYTKTRPRRIAQALDRQLLDLLEHGEIVADKSTGMPLIGEDGQPIRRPPSAALLTAGIRRLNDLRSQGETEKADPIAVAVAKAQAHAQQKDANP